MEIKNWVIIGLTIVAAGVAVYLSVYQYVDGVKKEKKNDSLQTALIKSQSDLVQLQNETIKRIMGFGYAKIIPGIVDTGECKLFVFSQSDYPIYETEIVIYDEKKINSCPKVIRDGKPFIMNSCYEAASMEMPIFTLNAHKGRPLGYVANINDEAHLFIKITSKHNTTFQYSIIKKDNSKNSQQKGLTHYYRIFEVLPHEEFKLLEKDTLGSNESLFEKSFQYKTDIPLLFDK